MNMCVSGYTSILMCVCVCVCVCVLACMRVYVCAGNSVSVTTDKFHVCGHVHENLSLCVCVCQVTHPS